MTGCAFLRAPSRFFRLFSVFCTPKAAYRLNFSMFGCISLVPFTCIFYLSFWWNVMSSRGVLFHNDNKSIYVTE